MLYLVQRHRPPQLLLMLSANVYTLVIAEELVSLLAGVEGP